MTEWLWVVACGAAFGAGVWLGWRAALLGVARLMAAGILHWRGGPMRPRDAAVQP